MSIKIIEGSSDLNTFIFLHGYLLSSEQWLDLKLHLAPWKSVLLDLPYHGYNMDKTLSSMTLDSYAGYVKNELAQLGVGKYTLIGHSMGGYIGLNLLQIDDNLENLVLLHSNVWEDSPERKLNRTRVAKVVQKNKTIFLRESLPLLFKDKEKHQSTIAALVERASSMSSEGIVHGAFSMRDRKESHDIVRNNQSRCFFIQGSHDALIPARDAKVVWSQIGRMQHYYEIPNCGHMSHYERPRVLRKILEIVSKKIE